jgi:hypothetical protein
MNNITTIWSNPHLRYAVVALAALEVAGIWFPAFKAQLDSTSKIVQFYAIAAAANSSGTSTPPTAPAEAPKTP